MGLKLAATDTWGTNYFFKIIKSGYQSVCSRQQNLLSLVAEHPVARVRMPREITHTVAEQSEVVKTGRARNQSKQRSCAYLGFLGQGKCSLYSIQ